MARVIQCPACGAGNDLHELFCIECHTPLTGAAKTTGPPPPPADAEDGGPPVREDECEPAAAAMQVEAGVAVTTMEPRAAVPRATLSFEWGDVVVGPRETVGIGRDPEFCRHARELSGNMYVSRRHAEFFLDGEGFLTMRHLSRTNPTYLNGTPIVDVGESRRLVDDDEIGFSRHAGAVVRLG